MQFEDNQVVLFHGVVDLRKGASGLMALVDDPKPGDRVTQTGPELSLVWMG